MADEYDSPRGRDGRKTEQGRTTTYSLLAIVVALAAGILIGWAIYPGADFGMHLWAEALGIGVTLGLFTLINRWQVQRQYQRQLVDGVAGISNETARNAVHQITRRGWLSGEKGVLRGANLARANLREAYLRHANLQGAHLVEANLHEADLAGANLNNANLIKANVQAVDFTGADLHSALLQNTDAQTAIFYRADAEKVNFFGAKLTYANLREANLRDANFVDADLHGANMAAANLQGARIKDDCFDVETWLPDGVYWTPGTDLGRYTDPTHPNFWRASDEGSPAHYGGVAAWRKHRVVRS